MMVKQLACQYILQNYYYDIFMPRSPTLFAHIEKRLKEKVVNIGL